MLSLSDIAAKYNVPLRTIRYVPEHNILDLSAESSKGKKQLFTDFQGFLIGMCGILLANGISGDTLKVLMKRPAFLQKLQKAHKLGENILSCDLLDSRVQLVLNLPK